VASSGEDTFQRAVAALHAGNLIDAERLFKQLLQAQPKHIGALNFLATVLMQHGRFEEAEHYVRLALQENTASDVTFYNYGIILKSLKRPTEALEQFSRALAINPSNPETWNNRGTVLNDLKRHQEAVADFDRAISIDGDYAAAFYNKGNSLGALGLQEQSLNAHERARNLKRAEERLGRGHLFYQFEKYEDAYAAYDSALTLNPVLTNAWIGRRNAFAALNQYDKAHVAYDLRTVEFMPRDGSPLGVQIQAEPSSRTVKLVADPLMCPIVLGRQCWQVEELQFAKRVCTGGEPITLVDVGANMGLFTRQLLIALPAIVEAFAYEPESQNFACMVHNLEPFRGKVISIEAALSSKAGKMQFYLDPTNNGNYSLNPAAMPPKRIISSVETKKAAVECAAWMDRGRRVFYKSDTQGFDEVIATAIQPEFWPRVFAGIMELWCIKKPPFDAEVLAAILDSFPNKMFLANSDMRVSETPVSTVEALNYALGDNGMHRDLAFWR
jgi:FkbM family methyltransferase